MWALASADAAVVPSAEFADAMLLRLGAPLIREPAPCARCGCNLDLECRHALRCAPGSATRGHNRLRDTLLGLASLSDGAAVTEAIGLVPSAPALRPADVLTRAAFGRLSALDVCIACPDAQGAGDDAANAAVLRKLGDYEHVIPELSDEGVHYKPLAWTCWGRPHTDAKAAVRSMSLAAARRQGDVDADDLERRARGAIGVQVWRRAAQMVAACLPRKNPDPARVLPNAIVAARERLGLGGSPVASSASSSRASSRATSPVRIASPLPDHPAVPLQVGGALHCAVLQVGAPVLGPTAGVGLGGRPQLYGVG